MGGELTPVLAGLGGGQGDEGVHVVVRQGGQDAPADQSPCDDIIGVRQREGRDKQVSRLSRRWAVRSH